MSLSILQNYTAVRNTGPSVPFGASGGVAPYTYYVVPGGAGGSIGSTGIYTAPIGPVGTDVITVTDSSSPTPLTASASISVLTPIELVCDIVANQLAIPGQVVLYNQKWDIPTDSKLYVVVGVRSHKAFGNAPTYVGGSASFVAVQSVNVRQILNVDLFSRSTSPLTEIDNVVMALTSPYAQAQMELNGFYVAPLPESIVNLSGIDGPAIPYHLQLSVALQYAAQLTSSPSYFSSFGSPTLVPNS